MKRGRRINALVLDGKVVSDNPSHLQRDLRVGSGSAAGQEFFIGELGETILV